MGCLLFFSLCLLAVSRISLWMDSMIFVEGLGKQLIIFRDGPTKLGVLHICLYVKVVK